MSGGFFRGTSADQDTRFSNKQAKLLKSQKFAPELDHLVDMTKVKVDVIKPWIANRATELLGFEDEVLINFIYGLLDAKEVDGKQIQIQLTGFMEKNTGKFMKELWSLLLSAQKNVSGVPQQFLDAKEEETRKKKVEADRINHEIQKKREKEGREIEQDKHKKLDIKDDSVAVVDRSLRRAPSIQPEEEKEVGERRGSRAKGRHSNSPLSENRSPSRRAPSETRSDSKSFSNSRSYSEHKSRSMSRSPQLRRQSVSPDRQYHSPQRQPISPHRKRSQYSSRSPSKQRSPPPRQRSTSHSLHRSSSPIRRRSPRIRRRSPSPLRRQSPSPLQRRSPIPVRRRSPVARRRPPSPRWRSPSPLRRLSPSPLRRRWSPSPRHSPSPLRSRRRRRSPSPHWSPSPVRRRRRSPSPRRSTSPLGRRRSPSPLRRRRSPSSRRSPSPLRRRSLSPRRFPSPLRRRRSPSPLQSPIPLRRRRSPSPLPLPRSPRHQRRSPMRSPRRRAIESRISPKKRNRSRSPYRSHSPPHSDQRSSGTEHDSLVNGVESIKQRDAFYSQRVSGKRSPLRRAVERELVERSASGHKPLDSLPRQPPVSLRSPQCDPKAQRDVRQKSPVSSPSLSNSPSGSGSPSRIRRMASPSVSPIRKGREHPTRHDSPETSSEEEKNHAREIGSRRADSLQKRNRNSPLVDSRKKATAKSSDPEDGSPKKAAVYQSSEVEGNSDHKELRKTGRSDNSLRMDLPERRTQLVSNASEQVEYGPGGLEGKKFSRYIDHDERPSKKLTKYSSQDEMLNSEARSERTYSREDYRVDEKKLSSSDDEYSDRHHKKDDAQKSMRKLDRNKRANNDSDSDGNETHIAHHTEKKRSRRTESRDMALDEDVEYDSQKNERKEAKRRRKEEKKLRKEERRRRREERHRRREERRVGKLNPKYVDTVTPPSDFEKRHNDVDDSDGDVAARRDSHPSDTEGTESEQKKLEIELRKKALESLRAKKAISH